MVLCTVLCRSFICLLSSPLAHLSHSLSQTLISIDELLCCYSTAAHLDHGSRVYGPSTLAYSELSIGLDLDFFASQENTLDHLREVSLTRSSIAHTNRTEPNHSYTSVLVHLYVRMYHRTRCVDSFLSAVRTLPGPSTCYPLHQVRDTHTLTR